MRSNTLAKKFSHLQTNQTQKVDILRLSHNVRKNMKREEDEDNTQQYGNKND